VRRAADRLNLIRVMPAQGGGVDSRADVIVVGAGAVGLASAWRLAQRGLAVRVLDRADAGAATRVSAGMLAPVTEAEFGDERLLELTLRAADAWPAFAAELAEASGVDTGFRRNGSLAIALDRDELDEVRRLHEFRRSRGLAPEWLTRTACRELEPSLSPSCAGGSYGADDGEVDPRALVSALRAALDRLAVTVEHADVTSLDELDADTVVAASGAWADWLPTDVRPPVRPVKGQILRLRAREPLLERIVRTPECYIVPRASGEVIVGATVEERGFDTTVTAGAVHELLHAAYRAVPELAELELVEASAGLRPATPDNLPIVHRFDDRLVVATGHYRNGILLTPTTADAVAALAADARVPA